MDTITSTELNYAINNLQAAVSLLTQVAEGLEKDCCGIESSRCITLLRFLADNYSRALHDIKSLT